MWRIACLLVLVLFADPPRADACSCGLSSTSYPVDGDTKVPTDAELVIEQDRFAPAPVLRTQAGQPLAVETRTSASQHTLWYLLRPVAPLTPGIAYEVTTTDRAIRFTVRDQVAEPPTSPTITALAMSTANPDECGGAGTCQPFGGYYRTAIAFMAATRVAYYELVLSSAGKDSWSRLLPPEFYGVLDNTLCGEGSPVLAADEPWCAELTAVGFNGERATAPQVCTDVVGCGTGCTEEIRSCLEPTFEPGAEEVPHESTGCEATGSHPRGVAWTFAIVMLALGRRRATKGSRRRACASP